MEQLGYHHDGFTTGFDPILQIRFHSILNLKDKTAKDVLNNMDSLRKRNTKSSKNGVKVKFLTEEELPIFRSFIWSRRQNLKNSLIETTSFITIGLSTIKIGCLCL